MATVVTRFSHARVLIAVFKDLPLFHVLHFKLSFFLDHLRVQRKSSAFANRQHCQGAMVGPASAAAIVSKAPSIVATNCGGYSSLCRSNAPSSFVTFSDVLLSSVFSPLFRLRVQRQFSASVFELTVSIVRDDFLRDCDHFNGVLRNHVNVKCPW